MTRLIIIAFAVATMLCTAAAPAAACTGFLIADGGRVLAGNNEDFWNCDTKMWIAPSAEGRYGGIYFGHDFEYAQGGMNEKGLFFDGFATARNPIESRPDRKAYAGNIIEEVMATCATVDEAVAYLSKYDLLFLERAMLFFADRSGAAVIVEGDVFLRKKGRFQVVTNYYQSKYEGRESPCPRYRKAAAMLEKSGSVDLKLCRDVLDAVHVEGPTPTQYSNVCDLESGMVYLYFFHDFENPVVFDLAEELEKGARKEDIPSLFERNDAFEEFKAKREREQNAEIERRRCKDLDPEILQDYVGVYTVFEGSYQGASFAVSRDEEKLFIQILGQEMVEIIPEGEDRFFHLGTYGSVDYVFNRNESGKVTNITRRNLGSKVEARRTI